LIALWSIGAREGICFLSMCRATFSCEEAIEEDPGSVAPRDDRSPGVTTVAVSPGGGISVVVTLDAASKQLLVRVSFDTPILFPVQKCCAFQHSIHLAAACCGSCTGILGPCRIIPQRW
jgi:hypothetical protein